MRAVKPVATHGEWSFADQRGTGIDFARLEQRKQGECLNARSRTDQAACRDVEMRRRQNLPRSHVDDNGCAFASSHGARDSLLQRCIARRLRESLGPSGLPQTRDSRRPRRSAIGPDANAACLNCMVVEGRPATRVREPNLTANNDGPNSSPICALRVFLKLFAGATTSQVRSSPARPSGS